MLSEQLFVVVQVVFLVETVYAAANVCVTLSASEERMGCGAGIHTDYRISVAVFPFHSFA